jgi:hypothetical protein
MRFVMKRAYKCGAIRLALQGDLQTASGNTATRHRRTNTRRSLANGAMRTMMIVVGHITGDSSTES